MTRLHRIALSGWLFGCVPFLPDDDRAVTDLGVDTSVGAGEADVSSADRRGDVPDLPGSLDAADVVDAVLPDIVDSVMPDAVDATPPDLAPEVLPDAPPPDVACGGPCGVHSRCGGAMCECDVGFADCDLVRANGCEIDVFSDLGHCGACGRRCALANAEARCDHGGCVVLSCRGGYGDCDGTAPSGCETSLETAANCGACRVACAAPSRCSAMVCAAVACGASGQPCCATGSVCNSGATCVAGGCQPCGTAGARCCAGACGSSSVCVAGMCQVCGARAQPCCAGATCGRFLVCNGGFCERSTCGGAGQPCCAGPDCMAGLDCHDGTCSRLCGGLMQACCASVAPCDSGLLCSGSLCRTAAPTCGGDGQACCASAPGCVSGLVCASGVCRGACGLLTQPCCPSSVCRVGRCMMGRCELF